MSEPSLTDRQRKGYAEMLLYHLFKTKDIHKTLQALYNRFENEPYVESAFKEVVNEAAKRVPMLAGLADDMTILPDL